MERGETIQVKELVLENFMSYERQKIKFRQGSLVFIGNNGAGKSAILDAILFSLFKINPRSKGYAKLVKQGKRYARVTLIFNLNGREYLVERTITITKGGASVKSILRELPGMTIIARDKAVDEEIIKILNMNSKMFEAAIYVKQGEIAKLVEITPSERKQIIAKLLGIEDLEKAYEKIASIISDFEKNLAKIEGELSQEKTIRTQLEEKLRKIREVKNEIMKTDYEYTKTIEKIKILKETLDELDTKRKIYDS